MNVYARMSTQIKAMATQGKIKTENASKKCRMLDFLSTCDKADIELLFDSGAFNEIVKEYVRRGTSSMVEDDELSQEQAAGVIRSLEAMMDFYKASELKI